VAFRAAVRAVEDDRLILAGVGGLFASAAANSSLLTAPVPIVLFVWMLWRSRAKAAAFLAGGAMACIPLAWLFVIAPQQTIFSVLKYQGLYRRVDWPGAMSHDVDVLLAPLDSAQAMVLGVLALGGLAFVRKSGWERAIRSELYLCAWLAGSEFFVIANAHPNFPQYYMFAVPFLAILSCAGIYAAGTRLAGPDRPFWPIFVPSLIVILAFGKTVYERRGYENWRDAEAIAQKIREIHPAGPIFADDAIYFLLRYPIPPGFELGDSHKLDLDPATMAKMHLVSKAELERQIRSGSYDLVETWASEAWKEDDWIDRVGLAKIYLHHVTVGEGEIYWR
jgi:hypothetical protein